MAESNPEREAVAAAQRPESAVAVALEPGGTAPPSPVADEQSVMALLVSSTQDVHLTLDPPAAAPSDPSAPARKVREWLRLGADFVRETWFARRQSRELLALYRRVLIDEPQLSGRALYAKVVSLHVGGDAQQVQRVLLRAEQSFCEWPTEHALRFRDVVSYLVVTEYLRDHRASPGTHINMLNAVARVVADSC